MATQSSNQGVRISTDIEGMDAVLAHIPDGPKRHAAAIAILNAISTRARAEIARRVPRRTAASQRSVQQRVFESEEYAVVGDIGARNRVLLWLERGTGVFGPRRARIFPVHARALRWNQGTMGPGGNLRLSGAFKRKPGLHSVLHGPNADAGPVAGYAFARSIAGMRPQPSFRPGWEATLPFVPVVLDRVGRHALEGGSFEGFVIGSV